MSGLGSWLRLYRHHDPLGLYLCIVGLGYLLISVTWVLVPSHARQVGVDWVPFLTPGLVGIAWALGGGLAIFTGLVAREHRRWGLMGLQAVAFALACIFVVSSVIGVLPDSLVPGGRVESIITAISYFTYWGASWAVGYFGATFKGDVDGFCYR